ncbi:MAG: helix-turn-helix transcriptional regulator [Clostridia bacterium]|nr:helix-turn-helix transcriptional regulator [Clostridia bacterium]
MKFYEITLHSVPKFIFAYSVTRERYRNRFPSYENLLEISIIECGTIHYEYEGGTHSETPPGTLAPILKDLRCRTYTKEGVLQKHVTVGATADYDLVLHDTATFTEYERLRTAVSERGTILIPFQWDLGERYGEIAEILRRLIVSYTSMHETHLLDTLSEWFRLTGTLTEIVLSVLSGKRPSVGSVTAAYIDRAKEYVATHFREKITVDDLAKHLGISSGYFHAIFKKETGMTVIGYLNRYRIGIAKQYLHDGRVTLAEAAAAVGIDDPAYMSRLFKKVEGVSFREYVAKG